MNRLVSYFFFGGPSDEKDRADSDAQRSTRNTSDSNTSFDRTPSFGLPTYQSQTYIRPGPHPPQVPSRYRNPKHFPPSTLITIAEIDSNYGSSSSVTGSGSLVAKDRESSCHTSGRSGDTSESTSGSNSGGCRVHPASASRRGSSALSLSDGMVTAEDVEEHVEKLGDRDQGSTIDGSIKGKGKARAVPEEEDGEDLNLSGLSNESGHTLDELPDAPRASERTPRQSADSSPKHSVDSPNTSNRTRHVDRELTPKRGRGRGRASSSSTSSGHTQGYGMGVKRSSPDILHATRMLLELGEDTVRGLPSSSEEVDHAGHGPGEVNEDEEEQEILIVTSGLGHRRRGSEDRSEGDANSVRSRSSLGGRWAGRRASLGSIESSGFGERSIEVIARHVDHSPAKRTDRVEGGSLRSGRYRTTPNSRQSRPLPHEDGDESSPLLSETGVSAEPLAPFPPFYRRPIFIAGVKLSMLFAVFTAVLLGTLWFGIPPLEGEDRGKLKLPRSFADLKALTGLFQKYKALYPFRLCSIGIVGYLYVQTFSLPGSMYISILFGAAYGMFYGLVLSCLVSFAVLLATHVRFHIERFVTTQQCEATGALFCYSLSAVLGPPLLEIPAYRSRLETWRAKIMGDKAKGEAVGWDGVFAFLIVLRIAPFPPHWITNIVAPHLDISAVLFWSACFIGIGPVSVIHVTIGSGLDQMTSAEDFHILSLRNILGLIGVGVAVMIPVGLKRVFKKDLSNLNEAEDLLQQPDIQVLIHAPSASSNSNGHGRGNGFDPSHSPTTSDRTLRDLEDGYLSSDSRSQEYPYPYQARDSGVVLGPPGGARRRGLGLTLDSSRDRSGSTDKGSHDSRRRRGARGVVNRPMDLEEALDMIRDAKDEEVLAVVYADEADADGKGEIIDGLYKGGIGRVVDSFSDTYSDGEEEEEGEGRGVGRDEDRGPIAPDRPDAELPPFLSRSNSGPSLARTPRRRSYGTIGNEPGERGGIDGEECLSDDIDEARASGMGYRGGSCGGEEGNGDGGDGGGGGHAHGRRGRDEAPRRGRRSWWRSFWRPAAG